MSDNPLLPHLVTVTRNLETLMAVLKEDGGHNYNPHAICSMCRALAEAARAIQDANVAIARVA